MKHVFFLAFYCIGIVSYAQNSMIGDGFGGRLWYKPMNYTTGSYSAYTVCGDNRQLYGWGKNNKGQLAASVPFSVKPIKIEGMDKVSFYSTGYLMACIRNNGEGWVWGANIGTPKKVLNDAYFVDASLQHCAFVKKDGSIWCVGFDQNGSFGLGTTSLGVYTECQKMNFNRKAVRTACSESATYILCEDGSVWGVGSIYVNSILVSNPIKIEGLNNIVDIKATTYGFCALDKAGNVWTMGAGNQLGRSGDPDTPGKIDNLKNIVAISGCADGYHFLALDENNNAYGWGDNALSQCGVSAGTPVLTPVKFATNVIDIMAGEWYSYVVKTDHSLWACGYDSYIWLDQPMPSVPIYEPLRLNPMVPEMGLCKPSDYTVDSYVGSPDTLINPSVTLVFPNAFTPNADNLNDVFRPIIRPDAAIQSYSLKIFNRWGQLVFVTNDVNQGWNGTFQNKSCDVGVYFYLATYIQKGWRFPLVVKEDLTLIK